MQSWATEPGKKNRKITSKTTVISAITDLRFILGKAGVYLCAMEVLFLFCYLQKCILICKCVS